MNTEPMMRRKELVYALRNVKRLAVDMGDDLNGRQWGWKAKVARELGISREMLCLIVGNQIERLSQPTVERISKKAGVPLDVLMAP